MIKISTIKDKCCDDDSGYDFLIIPSLIFSKTKLGKVGLWCIALSWGFWAICFIKSYKIKK